MADDLNQIKNKTQAEQWREWVILAQGGDKKAYTALLSEISVFIRNILVGGLTNPDWADDIAQEVLISVHKALKTYDPQRPFRPWLMALVNFRRTDFLRKHYASAQDKKTDLEDYTFQTQNVTNPTHAGEYKDIERALAVLPEKQRRIFTRVKIEGYSVKEVAEELGMSESAVKVSAHRTQKKLQDDLG